MLVWLSKSIFLFDLFNYLFFQNSELLLFTAAQYYFLNQIWNPQNPQTWKKLNGRSHKHMLKSNNHYWKKQWQYVTHIHVQVCFIIVSCSQWWLMTHPAIVKKRYCHCAINCTFSKPRICLLESRRLALGMSSRHECDEKEWFYVLFWKKYR